MTRNDSARTSILRTLRLAAALVACAGLARALQAEAPTPGVDLSASIARLGSSAEAERDAALAELLDAGEAAARLALEGFDEAPPTERWLRAHVARVTGGEATLDAALALSADPDARVRRNVYLLLGRGDLSTRLDARIAALASAARDDTSTDARETALEGLSRLPGDPAVAALAQLVVELPAGEAARAAEMLADLPRARDRVRRLVQGAFSVSPDLPEPVLAELLVGYGRALAETPGGGESTADRAPFLLGSKHPSGLVRLGALRGWNAYLARNQALGQHERSLAVLAELAGRGLTPSEAHFRRAYVALADAADLSALRESARALRESVPPGAAADDRMPLFYGRYFEACADLAGGDGAAAERAFEEAGAVLDGLRAERVELRPHLARPSELHAAVAVDRTVFRALVEIGRVMAQIAQGAEPEDRSVLETARRAHVFALEAQWLGVSTNAPVAVGQWDPILDDNLAPRQLIFAGGRAPAYRPSVALELLADTYRALAGVAPLELPGFAPAQPARPDPRLSSPFEDPERVALLKELLIAERGRIERRLIELLERRSGDYIEDPIGLELRRLNLRARQLDDDLSKVEGGDLEPLRTLRLPCDDALVIAREQLALGEGEAAQRLVQQALDDLARAEIWETYYFKPGLEARLEVLLGSAHMDQGRADEAERAYLRALSRHEGLENLYMQRLREAAGTDAGLAGYRAQVARVRLDRSNVLVSLAVNANVRQRDPEKALEYFEQAYELQKNDFMRVLLACYRARSGRFDEARAELRQIAVAPGHYYNLACTHALMGESEEALDYLAREFAENHPDEASANRQREWAAGDPDLESLRDHPQFQRLVEVRAPSESSGGD